MAVKKPVRRKKYFTPAQANATLPLVRAIVQDITALARDLHERQERLARNRAAALETRVSVEGMTTTAAQALSRPTVDLGDVEAAGLSLDVVVGEEHVDRATLAAEFRYEGYVRRQRAQWARTLAQEEHRIPADFGYAGIPGLSREVVERLSQVRPETLGQAARVPGVTPAAVAIVAARLARQA